MEYEYNEVKKGHGVLALVMGILGIVVAFIIGPMFGLFGIIPAAILAAAAIVLGIMTMRSTRSSKGKGGLITGIIALLFVLIMWGMVTALGTFLKSDAIQKNVPTLAPYSGEAWRGIGGLMLKMSNDGVDLQKMADEMNAFVDKENAKVSQETSGGTAKQAADDAAKAAAGDAAKKTADDAVKTATGDSAKEAAGEAEGDSANEAAADLAKGADEAKEEAGSTEVV